MIIEVVEKMEHKQGFKKDLKFSNRSGTTFQIMIGLQESKIKKINMKLNMKIKMKLKIKTMKTMNTMNTMKMMQMKMK